MRMPTNKTKEDLMLFVQIQKGERRQKQRQTRALDLFISMQHYVLEYKHVSAG